MYNCLPVGLLFFIDLVDEKFCCVGVCNKIFQIFDSDIIVLDIISEDGVVCELFELWFFLEEDLWEVLDLLIDLDLWKDEFCVEFLSNSCIFGQYLNNGWNDLLFKNNSKSFRINQIFWGNFIAIREGQNVLGDIWIYGFVKFSKDFLFNFLSDKLGELVAFKFASSDVQEWNGIVLRQLW